jgi:hypothetical protein
MGMTKQTAELAAQNDSSLRAQAESRGREIIAQARDRNLTSPEAANHIFREICGLSGISDPYAHFKQHEMTGAETIFSKLEPDAHADLIFLMALAVLGNTLDFFKDANQALAEIPDLIQRGISFYRNDIAKLEALLAKQPQLILYLSDNAGEIYFDYPLYTYIRQRAAQTILIVKGGPSLNDLTQSELDAFQLRSQFGEISDTGTDGVGIEWNRVSAGFLHLVDQADLIISKGMANLESIYPKRLSCPVLFLFKAKCKPIQTYLHSPADSYWALWQDGTSNDLA